MFLLYYIRIADAEYFFKELVFQEAGTAWHSLSIQVLRSSNQLNEEWHVLKITEICLTWFNSRNFAVSLKSNPFGASENHMKTINTILPNLNFSS